MSSLVARLPNEVRQVCAVLWNAGHEAFVVGGAVRDLILGEARIADWDVATDAVPDRVQDLFDRVVPTGIQHGTVTVVGDGWTVEVTTYRAEGAYSDGRRPDQVVFVRKLEDDLARRDFTINALALDPRDGALRDPFGGRADLRARRIRAVGDPAQRFAEDGLRAMRAVRFAGVLAFDIDPNTLGAIPGTLHVFRRVAGERVLAELIKLLRAPRPSRGFEPMDHSGLLGLVLPGLAALSEPSRLRAFARADFVTSGDWRTRFAALHAEVGTPGARAALSPLRPAARDAAAVVTLLDALPRLMEASADAPSARRALSAIGRRWARQALELGRAHLAAGPEPDGQGARAARLLDLASMALDAGVPLEVGDLALDGEQVRVALGIEEGPRVGRELRRLLAAVLEEPALNDPAALLAILREGVPPT